MNKIISIVFVGVSISLSGCANFIDNPEPQKENISNYLQVKKICSKKDVIDYEEHCMNSFEKENFKEKYKVWNDCTERAERLFCK